MPRGLNHRLASAAVAGAVFAAALLVGDSCDGVDEDLQGRLPISKFLNRSIHPGFECLCGCDDANGYVYVGSNCGVFRFDGSRWGRATTIPTYYMCIPNGKMLYGASEAGLFRMEATVVNPSATVTLNEALVTAGLPRHRVGDFRRVCAVGKEAFAVQSWFLVRMSINENGTDKVSVISKPVALPTQLVFRDVLNVGNRPLLALTNQKEGRSTQFAWLNDDQTVTMVPEMQVDAPIYSFSQINDQETLGIGRDCIYRITADGVTDITPEGLRSTFRDFQDIVCLSERYYAVLTSLRGIALVDRELGVRSVRQREMPTTYTSPPFHGGFFSDKLGRLWIGGSQSLTHLDVLSGAVAWSTPNGEPITSLEIQDTTMVLTTTNQVFHGALTFDKWGTPHLRGLQSVERPGPWRQPRVSLVEGEFAIADRHAAYLLTQDAEKKDGGRIVDSQPDRAYQLKEICKIDESLGSYVNLFHSQAHHQIYLVPSSPSQPVIKLRRKDGEPETWEKSGEVLWDAGKGCVGQTLIDGDGNLWAAVHSYANGHSVQRIDMGSANGYRKYPINGIPFMFENRIYVLNSDSNSVLRYDPSSDRFAQDDEFNSLFNGSSDRYLLPLTTQITGDVGGRLLWGTSTENCLEVFRRNNRLLVFPIMMFDVKSHRRVRKTDHLGNLWMVAENQLCAYDNDRYLQQLNALETNCVQLSGVSLSRLNEDIPASQDALTVVPEAIHNDIMLDIQQSKDGVFQAQYPFTTGTLSISFGFPSVRTSDAVEFSTRMLGINDTWSNPSRETHRRFPALPPGEYQFEVRVSVPQRHHSPTTVLRVRVQPAWYQSRLFFAGSAGVIGALVVSLFSFRMARDRKQVQRLQSEVSERKVAEQRLRESQRELVQRERLRALGVMAAGVAHDVNNMLSPICMYAEMLQTNESLGRSEVKQMAASIAQCALDSSDIIRKLSPLHKYRPQDESVVDLSAIVHEVINNARARVRNPACVKSVMFRNEVDSIPLACVESDLREALTNVVNNSIDAIVSHGTVTLVSNVSEDEVVLEVIDDGIGMDDEVLQECCETFFSTKGVNGSGLGLATTLAILKSFNARLEIESEVGSGTVVRIALPRKCNAQVPVPRLTEREPEVFPCRILVAEDNEVTRESLVMTLESMGHLVRCADSVDVLQCLRNEPFDILLTDYRMPRINGFELCRLVKTRFPSLARIIMSGYEEMGIREHCEAFVQKPISTLALTQALHIVQDSSLSEIVDEQSDERSASINGRARRNRGAVPNTSRTSKGA